MKNIPKSFVLPSLLAGALFLGAAAPAYAGIKGGTEEDAAVPQGSFISTMPVPDVPLGKGLVANFRNQKSAEERILVATEEDAAVPQGSFISTMLVPNAPAGKVLAVDLRNGKSASERILEGTEEDAAVPQGSFTSTMPVPNSLGDGAFDAEENL